MKKGSLPISSLSCFFKQAKMPSLELTRASSKQVAKCARPAFAFKGGGGGDGGGGGGGHSGGGGGDGGGRVVVLVVVVVVVWWVQDGLVGGVGLT